MYQKGKIRYHNTLSKLTSGSLIHEYITFNMTFFELAGFAFDTMYTVFKMLKYLNKESLVNCTFCYLPWIIKFDTSIILTFNISLTVLSIIKLKSNSKQNSNGLLFTSSQSGIGVRMQRDQNEELNFREFKMVEIKELEWIFLKVEFGYYLKHFFHLNS